MPSPQNPCTLPLSAPAASLLPRLRCKPMSEVVLPSGGTGSDCTGTVVAASDLYDSNDPVTITPPLPAGGRFAPGTYSVTVAPATATAGVSQCAVSFTVSPCPWKAEYLVRRRGAAIQRYAGRLTTDGRTLAARLHL